MGRMGGKVPGVFQMGTLVCSRFTASCACSSLLGHLILLREKRQCAIQRPAWRADDEYTSKQQQQQQEQQQQQQQQQQHATPPTNKTTTQHVRSDNSASSPVTQNPFVPFLGKVACVCVCVWCVCVCVCVCVCGRTYLSPSFWFLTPPPHAHSHPPTHAPTHTHTYVYDTTQHRYGCTRLAHTAPPHAPNHTRRPC